MTQLDPSAVDLPGFDRVEILESIGSTTTTGGPY